MKQYLVGGALRDMLLGGFPQEYDWAFEGPPEEFLREHPDACGVGRSVNVYLLDGMEYMPLRGASIAEDLLARDLTINALALESNGRLHAHPQALTDLQHNVLRPASSRALWDDPARIFRTARFAAQFPEFNVHEEFFQQAHEVHAMGVLTQLPAERVGREVRKALAAPCPSRFLTVLAQGKLFSIWLQELEDSDTRPAGPLQWHRGSVLEHTCRIMDAAAGDPLAVWMALCHDLGKMCTPQDTLPHHYGHELAGVECAQALGLRLVLPSRYIKAGMLAAREHMKAGIYDRLRAGTRRDLLYVVHAAHLDAAFWKLVDADSRQTHSVAAMRDLQRLLAVKLPAEWRSKGTASAQKLRLLQCEALSKP